MNDYQEKKNKAIDRLIAHYKSIIMFRKECAQKQLKAFKKGKK